MTVRVTVSAVVMLLALGAHVPRGVAATAPSEAGAPLPSPDVLDLFGERRAATSETRPAAAEQTREIRRPERPERSARTTSEQQVVSPRGTGSRGWQLWDFVPLLAVLALIAGAAIVVKRFMPARRLLGGGVMQVLARTPLTGRQQLVLVRLGRRVLLLGVSPDRMCTLSVFDDPQEVAMLLGEVESGRPGSSTHEFRQSFVEEAGAYGQEEPAEPLDVAASGHVRGLLEKVRSLKTNKGVV